MYALFLMMALWIPSPSGPGVHWQQHTHPVKVAANLTEDQCHAAGKRALMQARNMIRAYACHEDIKA
ncbi:hypothetical protein [Candidatus Poriferisocius sp.]|uniref:hypothetical protein n=1 Tax=Candidatus Poriferisocius sp. TaxID=3101276 RepID=UPI003B025C7A